MICVEGLPYGSRTVMFGAEFACRLQCALTFLTVVDEAAKRPSAQEMLVEARQLAGKADAAIKVRVGTAVAAILAEADSGDYDLIVLGAHVIQGFWQHFSRSINDVVTRRAAISVLVVHPQQQKLKRLLICTGGQTASRRVVLLGADIAAAAQAEVGLLHVVDPMPGMYAGLEEMAESQAEILQADTPLARHLRWSLETFKSRGIPASLTVRPGIVAEQILLAAEEGGYDLIVLGVRSQGNFWRDMFVEQIVPPVLHKAACSILIARTAV